MTPAPARVLVFDDLPSLAAHGVKVFRDTCSEVLAGSSAVRVALSGGQTPVGFYTALADSGRDIPWASVRIFQVDERFVPASDARSNFRLLKETLFDRVPIPPDNIHPIMTGVVGPEESAWLYEEALGREFRPGAGSFARFDLLMLGLGEDGHTASLFAGSDVLCEARRSVRAVRLGRPLHDRVTLTLPVINNARRVVFLVEGPEKAVALKRTVEDRSAAMPAAWVKPDSGELIFLADKAAAGLLSEATRVAGPPGGSGPGPGRVPG